MQYEPIKKVLGNFFNKNVYSRIIFYRLLDFMMIKTWHIHRQLGAWAKKRGNFAHILDAAGGFGHYTYYLSQKNIHWNILSVDINTEQVCDCNTFFQKLKRHNVVFKSMNLEEMEDENAFDLILSIGVLEYIKNDEVVLKNFYRALKDGGMLLISSPSLRSKNPSTTEQVRRGYGKKELEKQLKELGFKHVKSRYIVGIMGNSLICLV